MLRVDVVTIFPRMLEAPLADGIVARAMRGRARRDRASTTCASSRTTATARVDDAPFGGGPGMVMKAEPFFRAVETLLRRGPGAARRRRAALAARAGASTSATAERYRRLDRLVLLCGRYEGDRRAGARGPGHRGAEPRRLRADRRRGGGARRDRGRGAPPAGRAGRRGLGGGRLVRRRPARLPALHAARATCAAARVPEVLLSRRPREDRGAGAGRRRCARRASGGPTSSRARRLTAEDEAPPARASTTRRPMLDRTKPQSFKGRNESHESDRQHRSRRPQEGPSPAHRRATPCACTCGSRRPRSRRR